MNSMNLGDTLRWMRLSLNWSLSEMAKKLEASAGYVSHMERGQRNPSFNMLKRASALMGVPVTFVIFLNEAEAIQESHPEFYRLALDAEPRLRGFLDRKNHQASPELVQGTLFGESP